ncbi:putative calcium-binding protein CML15, partial [Mucuna pruriens]
MATPELSSIVQPEQQQAGSDQAVPSTSAWQSSGSVGPFFAVMSVLLILSLLSCYLGRKWNRRPKTPLESIRGRGFFGWLKRRIAKDVQVGGVGAKVMVCDHDDIHHCKLNDGEVAHQNPTQLQVHQVNQLREIFGRFDMDSDGSLTTLELAALLRSLGLKPTGEQVQALLSNMDSNGNGKVEFDELVRTILPDINTQILLNQEQLLEVFKCFDRDGNGYISAVELAGAMAKMGQPLTYRELTEMIKEADMDGDGVISFAEFASIMARSASDFLGLAFS